MSEHFDALLQRARKIVETCRPKASRYRKAAFTNSLVELVTGESAGLGGPSLRQHIAVQTLSDCGMSFEEIAEELLNDDGLIFGLLSQAHRDFWREHSEICFDDDPNDIAFLNGDPGLN